VRARFILEHVSTSAILADFGVEMDAGGCVLVDKDQKTSVSGLFAAGDCSCKGFQVVTATGMGASAALNAMRYVKQLK
jgi:thioredoxin reductase (NADPH)